MAGCSSMLSNCLLGEHNSTDSWEDRKWKYKCIFLILCLSICIWILSEAKSQTRWTFRLTHENCSSNLPSPGNWDWILFLSQCNPRNYSQMQLKFVLKFSGTKFLQQICVMQTSSSLLLPPVSQKELGFWLLP